MQLNLDSDWGVLFPPDSNAHSGKICHRIRTQHHNTHANYILIIKHSNKQTERKSPRNHQVLMEQVLAWCAWPDSLLLDQSVAGFARGREGGDGETHWCHCLALQSYRERRRRFCRRLNERRRKRLALIQTGYTELLLNEDERTKEETGNVNFKRPGLGALAPWLPGGEAQKTDANPLAVPGFTVIKILKGF